MPNLRVLRFAALLGAAGCVPRIDDIQVAPQALSISDVATFTLTRTAAADTVWLAVAIPVRANLALLDRRADGRLQPYRLRGAVGPGPVPAGHSRFPLISPSANDPLSSSDNAPSTSPPEGQLDDAAPVLLVLPARLSLLQTRGVVAGLAQVGPASYDSLLFLISARSGEAVTPTLAAKPPPSLWSWP